MKVRTCISRREVEEMKSTCMNRGGGEEAAVRTRSTDRQKGMRVLQMSRKPAPAAAAQTRLSPAFAATL